MIINLEGTYIDEYACQHVEMIFSFPSSYAKQVEHVYTPRIMHIVQCNERYFHGQSDGFLIIIIMTYVQV